MKAFQGGLRIAFLCFFWSHIPITIFIDSQALTKIHPSVCQQLVKWYSETFGDFLMDPTILSKNYQVWFTSFVTMEVLFQFPFFIVAIRQLQRYNNPTRNNNNNNNKDDDEILDCYPSWFQKLCIVYGTHTSTTLIPILVTFMTSSTPDQMTIRQKCATVTVYSPYLIFPMTLVYYAIKDDFVFPPSTSSSSSSSSSVSNDSTSSSNVNKDKSS